MRYLLLALICLSPTLLTPETYTTRPLAVERCQAQYTDHELATLALQAAEGLLSVPQWDVNAYRSGYGTPARGRQERITLREARRRSAEAYGGFYERLTADYPCLDDWTAQVVTLTLYNVGSFGAGMRAALRSGDRGRIAAMMTRYVKSQGKVLPGLVARRALEVKLLTADQTEREALAVQLQAKVNKDIERVYFKNF